MPNIIRRGFITLAVASACALAACGGGGSSDDDGESQTLQVTFNYPDQEVDLFASVRIVPELDGLEGHTPTITVTDVLSGGLPTGLTVDSASGTIEGTALQVGRYTLGANLTADGVEGNLTTSFELVVSSDIAVSYSSTAQTLFAGDALAPMSPTLSGILPGDVLSFEPVATMPPPAGIGIDLATGVVSGTPNVTAGTYTFPVRMTVTRGANTATFISGVITFVMR
jgi:hypothetical protein